MAVVTLLPYGATQAAQTILGGGIPIAEPTSTFLSDANTSVSTEIVVGSTGGQIITLPFFATASSALFIISSSANDAAAGTGARTVSIVYFDGSENLMMETIALNGVTQVALTGTYRAIICMYIATAGSGHTAAGNITVSDTGQAHYYCGIATSANCSSAGYIYVPTHSTGGINLSCWFTDATTATDAGVLTIYQYEPLVAFSYQIFTMAVGGNTTLQTSQNGPNLMNLDPGLYKITIQKVGTTAQAFKFNIHWGFRFI